MKRKLTDAEEKMVQRIANVIGKLDGLVFPENSINKITAVRAKPPSGFYRFSYFSPENAEDGIEHYQIYGYGVDKVINEERKKRVILLQELKRKEYEYEDLPKLTLEEILIGLAAHEVRHRVQYHLPIELLSLELLDEIDNSYVRGLIDFIKLLYEEEPPKGDYNLEFDAKSIEYMVIEMWHWGERNASKIASKVKAGAREIQPFGDA